MGFVACVYHECTCEDGISKSFACDVLFVCVNLMRTRSVPGLNG